MKAIKTSGAGSKSIPKPRKLLRYRDLLATRGLPFSRRHLYDLEAAGKFPRRVKIGEHAVGWVESEIDAYLENAIAKRES